MREPRTFKVVDGVELSHKTDIDTIIVSTRLSESKLSTTYINNIGDPDPYVVVVVLGEQPFRPVGVPKVPEVGRTIVFMRRIGENIGREV